MERLHAGVIANARDAPCSSGTRLSTVAFHRDQPRSKLRARGRASRQRRVSDRRCHQPARPRIALLVRDQPRSQSRPELQGASGSRRAPHGRRNPSAQMTSPSQTPRGAVTAQFGLGHRASARSAMRPKVVVLGPRRSSHQGHALESSCSRSPGRTRCGGGRPARPRRSPRGARGELADRLEHPPALALTTRLFSTRRGMSRSASQTCSAAAR